METEINEDQLKVVNKLEKVLNFLKHTPIKNKESLKYIDKPLEDLLSSLKYLPTDPPFDLLPPEIKTDILGYLCNSGTLVAASVCQEWKEILTPQLDELGQVLIGKHCSNKYECEDGKCCLPEAMLKAFTTLELDVPLTLCHPVTEVDPQLVGEGLASASSLRIEGDCACVGDDYDDKLILTNEQKEQLLVALENRSKVREMELRAINLNNLNQDRLVNVLINKICYLNLEEDDYKTILDIRKLVQKLKDSTDYRLRRIRMDNVQYPDDIADDMADALCQVTLFSLRKDFHPKVATIVRLRENILNRPIATVALRILRNMNWSILINPDDLKTIVDKLVAVDLRGLFTAEQLEAVRSCPGVEVDSNRITKDF